jgi:hypothetical protein
MAKKTERCIWPKKEKMENQNNFFLININQYYCHLILIPLTEQNHT